MKGNGRKKERTQNPEKKEKKPSNEIKINVFGFWFLAFILGWRTVLCCARLQVFSFAFLPCNIFPAFFFGFGLFIFLVFIFLSCRSYAFVVINCKSGKNAASL